MQENKNMTDKDRLKKLATNLKRERLKRNLSQEELAELVNISRNSVSLIETGKINPTVIKVIDIAKALGIEVSSLTNDV